MLIPIFPVVITVLEAEMDETVSFVKPEVVTLVENMGVVILEVLFVLEPSEVAGIVIEAVRFEGEEAVVEDKGAVVEDSTKDFYLEVEDGGNFNTAELKLVVDDLEEGINSSKLLEFHSLFTSLFMH